jgi:hypothetical protein
MQTLVDDSAGVDLFPAFPAWPAARPIGFGQIYVWQISSQASTDVPIVPGYPDMLGV